MKKIVIGLFALGLASLGFSQEVVLDDIIIKYVNKAYVNNVIDNTTDSNVKQLETYVANYNVNELDDFNTSRERAFEIQFKQKSNSIVALYDNDGRIISSKEYYRNVLLPHKIRVAISKSYPNWTLYKDSYHVNYNKDSGSKKMYKITLKQGKKKKRLKLDNQGNLI